MNSSTTTTEFVDPRSNPEPPARVSREPAVHGEDLRDLLGLCLAGRIYDIEGWIQQVRLWGYQRYYRAYSLVNGGRARETDLFAGLRTEDWGLRTED